MQQVATVEAERPSIQIIADAGAADIEAYPISSGLGSIVRGPAARTAVFRRLAADPQARMTLAVADGVIVGRASIGPSFGRWRALPRVREFGYEAARESRHRGVAAALTRAALSDPAVEDEIVLAFLWPSAWDAEYERLSPSVYRRRLVDAAVRAGFRPAGTDEPEVLFQWGAALYMRVGARVPADAIAAFEQARYLRRGEHQAAA